MTESRVTNAEIRARCRRHARALLRDKPPRTARQQRSALARAIALLAWPDRMHDRLRY